MKVLILARDQTLIDRMVAYLRGDGLDPAGTTNDDEALTRVWAGEIETLVIGGGVDEESRLRLVSEAERCGIAVLPRSPAK